MPSFKATIEIIGINPFVFVPDKILAALFKKAGKDKGPIPIKGVLNKKAYKQTLVRYQGEWRLYINTTMLKDSPKLVGTAIEISVDYDAEKREQPMHPKFAKALNESAKAKKVFDSLIPSRKLEIVRYLNHLKTEESLNKNIERAVNFLLGKERFVGRDKP